MPKVSVRFSDEEYKHLEELAEQGSGATVSDVIRDMFRAHYSKMSMSNALAEIRREIVGEIKKMSGPQNGNSNSNVLAEILRIVTIIASTMPAASKQL